MAYSEGARITIWRWRGWVLKARSDGTPSAVAGIPVTARQGVGLDTIPFPGDERQQRQARDWVRTGFWLRSGMWGPAPDQPGCTLPAELVAWCRAARLAAA